MTANLSRAELLEMALSSDADKNPRAPNEATLVPAQSEPVRRPEEPARRSEGGTSEIHTFLEHRSRQWSAMLRLQEQQRQQVQSLETERDAEYKRLEIAVDGVQKALRALRTVTDLSKDGRITAEVEKAMEVNRNALDQLETVAANLNTNFLAWRSSWQQYAQSLDAAKRIRADMEARMLTRA